MAAIDTAGLRRLVTPEEWTEIRSRDLSALLDRIDWLEREFEIATSKKLMAEKQRAEALERWDEQRKRIEELGVDVREWEKSYGSLENLWKLQRERIEELGKRDRFHCRLLTEYWRKIQDQRSRIEELEAVAEAARVLSDVDLNYRGDLDHQRLQDALADLREALARLDGADE